MCQLQLKRCLLRFLYVCMLEEGASAQPEHNTTPRLDTLLPHLKVAPLPAFSHDPIHSLRYRLGDCSGELRIEE